MKITENNFKAKTFIDFLLIYLIACGIAAHVFAIILMIIIVANLIKP